MIEFPSTEADREICRRLGTALLHAVVRQEVNTLMVSVTFNGISASVEYGDDVVRLNFHGRGSYRKFCGHRSLVEAFRTLNDECGIAVKTYNGRNQVHLFNTPAVH